MFILKKGHQPGVYVPLRALFLVFPVIALFSSPEPKAHRKRHLLPKSTGNTQE